MSAQTEPNDNETEQTEEEILAAMTPQERRLAEIAEDFASFAEMSLSGTVGELVHNECARIVCPTAAAIPEPTVEPRTCPACKRPFYVELHARPGRTRTHCDGACKQRAYRERQSQASVTN